MAIITLALRPHSVVATHDYASDELGRGVGFTLDGATVHCLPASGHVLTDADTIAGLSLLIDELVALRASAMARHAADIGAEPLPDGLEFIGTVGQFLDYIQGGAPESELRALAGDR